MSKLPISTKLVLNGEVLKPLVEAVSDLFAPVTEPMGWLGDIVRNQRVRSAVKCFRLAKRLADEQGFKLKAPPAKFLSQYVDSCSLESEDDKKLIEWWARLLVDAGSDFQSKHIFYSNILKQITATELELLECLVRNGPGSYVLELATEAEFVHDFNFDASDLTLPNKLTAQSAKKASASFRKAFERPGTLVLDFFVDDENSRQYQEFHPDYSDEELASWQVLQSLQLVRLGYHRLTVDSIEYRVRTALITELGAKFYFSCHEPNFHRKTSGKMRYKRVKKVKRTSRR